MESTPWRNQCLAFFLEVSSHNLYMLHVVVHRAAVKLLCESICYGINAADLSCDKVGKVPICPGYCVRDLFLKMPRYRDTYKHVKEKYCDYSEFRNGCFPISQLWNSHLLSLDNFDRCTRYDLIDEGLNACQTGMKPPPEVVQYCRDYSVCPSSSPNQLSPDDGFCSLGTVLEDFLSSSVLDGNHAHYICALFNQFNELYQEFLDHYHKRHRNGSAADLMRSVSQSIMELCLSARPDRSEQILTHIFPIHDKSGSLQSYENVLRAALRGALSVGASSRQREEHHQGYSTPPSPPNRGRRGSPSDRSRVSRRESHRGGRSSSQKRTKENQLERTKRQSSDRSPTSDQRARSHHRRKQDDLSESDESSPHSSPERNGRKEGGGSDQVAKKPPQRKGSDFSDTDDSDALKTAVYKNRKVIRD